MPSSGEQTSYLTLAGRPPLKQELPGPVYIREAISDLIKQIRGSFENEREEAIIDREYRDTSDDQDEQQEMESVSEAAEQPERDGVEMVMSAAESVKSEI